MKIDVADNPPTQEEINDKKEKLKIQIEATDSKRLLLHVFLFFTFTFVVSLIGSLDNERIYYFISLVSTNQKQIIMLLTSVMLLLSTLPVILILLELSNFIAPPDASNKQKQLDDLNVYNNYNVITRLIKTHPIAASYFSELKKQKREITYLEYRTLDNYISNLLKVENRKKQYNKIYK